MLYFMFKQHKQINLKTVHILKIFSYKFIGSNEDSFLKLF